MPWVEFIHPLFSSDALRRGKFECQQDGETIWSKRFMPNDEQVSDFLRQAFQVERSAIDRWLLPPRNGSLSSSQRRTQNVAALREPFEQEDKPVVEAVDRWMGGWVARHAIWPVPLANHSVLG